VYVPVSAEVAVSVEPTPYGTWRARWRDDTGKSRARSFRRKIDAERFDRKMRTSLDHGTYLDPKAGEVTVRAMAHEWLNGAMNLRTGAMETYTRDLDRYVLPKLGGMKLSRLTPAVIDDWLADELASGLAPSSVHRHYRTLRRLLQVAVDKGRLARNPCDPVTPPRIPPREMRFLTVEQVEALAAAVPERHRAWVYVAAYDGLRWSECVGLRREHVDGARITVAGQLLRRVNRTWQWEDAKTRAGRRTVTSPAFVAAALETHMEKHSGEGAKGLVFPNRDGGPIIGSSFTGNVFKPALERAGLDTKVRIHDLRHTAVALAVAAGAHPKAIQVRMGHASISVTLDRYGGLFPEQDEVIAAGLDDLRGDREVTGG